MVLYKLVEGGELHHPKKILSSTVTKNFEVLDIIAIPVSKVKTEIHEENDNQIRAQTYLARYGTENRDEEIQHQAPK